MSHHSDGDVPVDYERGGQDDGHEHYAPCSDQEGMRMMDPLWVFLTTFINCTLFLYCMIYLYV